MIFTEDQTLPIEEGDRFERQLPNGIVESYVVLDTGFKQGYGSIGPHYQTKIRRVPKKESVSSPRTEPSLEVFISHSSHDVGVTKCLITLLRSALRLPASAIRCTSVDGYRLPGGADTDEQLRREVHESRAFIGVISAASLGSMYVAFELGARWGARRPLLPLLAPGTNPSIISGPLSGMNALQCDSGSQLHQMVNELSKLLDIEPEPAHVFQAEIEAILRVPNN